jgi:hypothetical protein
VNYSDNHTFQDTNQPPYHPASNDHIMPVQVSSTIRPTLNPGPNDTYITKVQFDENMVEASEDETNER